jgi:hypothetical protein
LDGFNETFDGFNETSDDLKVTLEGSNAPFDPLVGCSTPSTGRSKP